VPFLLIITNTISIGTVLEFQSRITNLVMEKGSVNHNKPFCDILVHVKSGSVAIKL